MSVLCSLTLVQLVAILGLLHASRTWEISGGKARVGCYEDVLNMEGVTRQELLQLDSEGRCLVTDHSSFGMFWPLYIFEWVFVAEKWQCGGVNVALWDYVSLRWQADDSLLIGSFI